MTIVQTNGIQLETEVIGNGEPLLMIHGLGAQLIHWPRPFLEELVCRGFQVITFDNRDVAKSTWLDHLGVPAIHTIMLNSLSGKLSEVPYTLEDMADDTIGLLDGLGIAKAHVLGLSLGGMIAQVAALKYPDRLVSLTSMMSATGSRREFTPTPSAMTALMKKAPTDRDAYIENRLIKLRQVGASLTAQDEDDSRATAKLAFDRGLHPQGVARQMAAMFASGSRYEQLKSLAIPSLVIHGRKDPLAHVRGGRRTARAIPGAKYVEIAEMGHHLSRAFWPQMIHAISDHLHASTRQCA